MLAAVAAKPPPSALTATPSWAAKRARGARRRRRVPSPSRRCWADLTYGVAGAIAEHALANDVSDYMSFRAVCRGWRRGTDDDAALRPPHHRCLDDRRFHPHQWIMLREAAPPGPGRHRRRFLNVATGQCVHTELPELDGHRLLGATTEGLLVMLDESTFAARVLNPVTRQVAELPSLDPLLPPETRTKISKYGLAYGFKVTGFGLAGGDSAVALCVYDPTMVIVARPGDERWTLVDDERWFYSALSFSGRFYCVNNESVMALGTTANNKQPPRLVVAAKVNFPVWLKSRDSLRLVENDGRLLLIRRQLSTRGQSTYCWIREYKDIHAVDLAAKETVAVTGLSGRAVFLGKTRALSVSPLVFPSIRADTVYPAATMWEKMEMGVGSYGVLDGSIERCKVRMIRKMYEDDEMDGGWARPCGIDDYLSWYVSRKCNAIEEI
ncbi:unnamed protein product [Urochloa decumbens]|uniref:KIB1-4 beta-propeller domain-containing protein n=1 Tax=Urochloa decumbens TaxID=240449 RepID=A0ABC9FXR3_9POAL